MPKPPLGELTPRQLDQVQLAIDRLERKNGRVASPKEIDEIIKRVRGAEEGIRK